MEEIEEMIIIIKMIMSIMMIRILVVVINETIIPKKVNNELNFFSNHKMNRLFE